jgi:hypothetical protein
LGKRIALKIERQLGERGELVEKYKVTFAEAFLAAQRFTNHDRM